MSIVYPLVVVEPANASGFLLIFLFEHELKRRLNVIANEMIECKKNLFI